MADWDEDDVVVVDGEEEGVISQEDCWSVIQSYFDENVSSLSLSKACIVNYFSSPLFKHKSPPLTNSYKIQFKNLSMSHHPSHSPPTPAQQVVKMMIPLKTLVVMK